MKKRTLALLLALVTALTLLFAACAKGGNEPEAPAADLLAAIRAILEETP